MKKHLLLFILLVLGTFILSSGCKKASESSPCNNTGTLCIENKLDSTITVSVKPTHDQYTIDKNYMHCSDLTGGQSYTINISATGINRDTTLTILNCDKKLLIIQ